MNNRFLQAFSVCLLSFLLVSCSSSSSPKVTSNVINQDVSQERAKELIKNNPELIIIDVRTPAEIAQGKIKNAIEIDYKTDKFEEEISKLDKDKKYLVYCASGGRSGRTLKKMSSLGFKESYNLLGGYNDWKE